MLIHIVPEHMKSYESKKCGQIIKYRVHRTIFFLHIYEYFIGILGNIMHIVKKKFVYLYFNIKIPEKYIFKDLLCYQPYFFF